MQHTLEKEKAKEKEFLIQKMKKPGSKITIGNLEEVMRPDALREALTEFICVLLFIFSAEGCVMYFTKIYILDNPGYTQVFAFAITHGFGLLVAVGIGMNISGGLSNPAVTFGAFVGGHITLVKAVLYSFAQCLGGFAALGILKLASNGLTVHGWAGKTPLNGIIYMIAQVFFLTYAYYATIFDPKRGKKEIIAPIVIGLICACNVLCGGGGFGAAMNPAMALCIAAFSGMWNNHWSYWVGTYIGAALAALVYQTINTSDDGIYEQLPITKPVNEDTYKQLLITKP